MVNKDKTSPNKVFADFESDILAGIMAGKPLGGTEGVLTNLIKHVVEKSMNAELGEHLLAEAAQLDAQLTRDPIPNTQYPIPNTQYPIPNTQYLLPNT